MVYIPAGSFEMGAVVDPALSLAGPPHRVTLSAYCIDRTEVTAEAFARCRASGCDAPRANRGGYYCAGAARNPQHPRNCVNWYHADAFCAARGARLPTEAEWEYAARGPRSIRYPWGEEPPDSTRARYAAYTRESYPPTAPVGTHPAGRSPFGVEDMAGNVAEWTADSLGVYTAAPSTNPVGSAPDEAALRGGSYSTVSEHLSTWDRLTNISKSHTSDSVGFRCAASPAPP